MLLICIFISKTSLFILVRITRSSLNYFSLFYHGVSHPLFHPPPAGLGPSHLHHLFLPHLPLHTHKQSTAGSTDNPRNVHHSPHSAIPLLHLSLLSRPSLPPPPSLPPSFLLRLSLSRQPNLRILM